MTALLIAESLTRLAPKAAPLSVDTAARTAELVVSTGAAVNRPGYVEIIDVNGWRSKRHQAGNLFLLDSHRYDSNDSRYGRVTRIWLASGELRARVVFDRTPAGDRGLALAAEGAGVSFGYEPLEWRDAPDASTGEVLRTITAFEILEVSLVNVAADPVAQVRSASMSNTETAPGAANAPDMSAMVEKLLAIAGELQATLTEVAAAVQRKLTPEAFRAELVAKRSAASPLAAARAADLELRKLVRLHGLEEEFADRLVSRGIGPDQAAPAILAELNVRQGGNFQTIGAGRMNQEEWNAHVAQSDGIARCNANPDAGRSAYGLAARAGGGASAVVGAAAEALFMRDSPAHKPSADARFFVGQSFDGMARTILETRGQRTAGLSKSDIITRMMSTGDLPALLANVGNKVLEVRFAAAPLVLEQIGAVTTFKDFKEKRFTKLSEFPGLDQNNESSDIKYGAFDDAFEVARAYRYAKLLSVSREMLVNDDLGALTDGASMAAEAVISSRAGVLFTLFAANAGTGATLKDGNPTFHSSRGNIATGGASALSEASLNTAAIALRRQKSLKGNALANEPAFLVVPPELEQTARKLTTAITSPTSTSAVNTFANLAVLVEARFTSATRWYLVAAPSRNPLLRFGTLEGNSMLPQFATREAWERDEVEMRVVDYYGAGFVEPKSAHTSAGA